MQRSVLLRIISFTLLMFAGLACMAQTSRDTQKKVVLKKGEFLKELRTTGNMRPGGGTVNRPVPGKWTILYLAAVHDEPGLMEGVGSMLAFYDKHRDEESRFALIAADPFDKDYFSVTSSLDFYQQNVWKKDTLPFRIVLGTDGMMKDFLGVTSGTKVILLDTECRIVDISDTFNAAALEKLMGLKALSAPASKTKTAAVPDEKSPVSDQFQKPFRVKIGESYLDLAADGGSFCAAPLMVDWYGHRNGVKDLLVGQYANGRMRIYRNYGTATKPVFKDYEWFRAGNVIASLPMW